MQRDHDLIGDHQGARFHRQDHDRDLLISAPGTTANEKKNGRRLFLR